MKYAQTVLMFVKNKPPLYRRAGSEVVSLALGVQQQTAQRPCPPGAYCLVGGRGENWGPIYNIYVGDSMPYRGR